jgi:hypothetical protein
MGYKKRFLWTAIIIFCVLSVFCKNATGPDGGGGGPKVVSVNVEYSRVPPIPNPDTLMTEVFLFLLWDPFQARQMQMIQATEDAFFIDQFPLKTETIYRMWVNDPKMADANFLNSWQVRKTLKIDGQELGVSSLYGELRFIYQNDGTIKIYE